MELGKPWEGKAESEIIVRFKLLLWNNERTVRDLVHMCGVRQHGHITPEYSDALARIAAMDPKRDKKLGCEEISVPSDMPFEGTSYVVAECLDAVLKIRKAEEIIRQELEEKVSPALETGDLRCSLAAKEARLWVGHGYGEGNSSHVSQQCFGFTRIAAAAHRGR
ncbi:hypothetical protein P3T76_006075 [Phytophthora citrophthora]|uniref:Uncharacterized protein n=1 Tax=Phytophthora citrophthora TaxID=4793 RepID=A0AAD9LNM5_9STRA|nr:hypothetical protein P3T76_006075 [Phytophthora citrophthora]